MRLGLAAVLLVMGCSERELRDPTEEEVRSVAAKCGAVVTRFGQTVHENKNGLSNRELELPNVSLTIKIQTRAEFSTKANCLDRELKALGAWSFIYGPNGEDLLVSDGRDRLS